MKNQFVVSASSDVRAGEHNVMPFKNSSNNMNTSREKERTQEMIDRKTCRTCVLPDSSSFHLDITGNCPLCNSPALFKHILKKPDEAKLDQMLTQTRQKGEGRRFDCIVAWSGGRDSTFMLHELVTRHGLRCVAVFGRTPFTPDEIADNVHSIAENLNIKLIEIATPSNHQEIAAYCLREY